MNIQRRVLLAAITAFGALGVYEGFSLATDHLASPDFPDHAKFHAALSGLHMLALTGVLLLLAWGPFRRGQDKFQPILCFTLVALPASVFTAVAVVPAGAPPRPLLVFAVIVLVIASALAVAAWRIRLP